MHKPFSTIKFFQLPFMLLEAIFLLLCMVVFKIIGLKNTHKTIKLFLNLIFNLTKKPEKIIDKNIELIFPKLSTEEKSDLKKNIKNSMALNIAEMMFLKKIMKEEKFVIKNKKMLEEIKNSANSALLISGHFGNWEVTNHVFQTFFKERFNYSYRSINNPFVNYILLKIRTIHDKNPIPKGNKGMVQLIQSIKEKKIVFLMADQHLTEGEDFYLCGIKCKTPISAFKISKRYKIPVYVFLTRRDNNNNTEIEVMKKFTYDDNLSEDENKNLITQGINDIFSHEIKNNPKDWFWPQRRFRNEDNHYKS